MGEVIKLNDLGGRKKKLVQRKEWVDSLRLHLDHYLHAQSEEAWGALTLRVAEFTIAQTLMQEIKI